MSFDSCGRCRTCQRGQPSYCHAFFEHNFAASRPADGSSASRAAVNRARALLRPVELRHALGRARAQRREGRPTTYRSRSPRRSAAVSRPGAGAVLNVFRPPAGSEHRGIRRRRRRARGGAGGVDRRLHDDRRRRRASRRGSSSRASSARPPSSTPARRTPSRRSRGSPAAAPISASRRRGSPEVLRSCVDCLAPHGVCGVVGAPAVRHRGVARREHDPHRRPRRPWDRRGRQRPRPTSCRV